MRRHLSSILGYGLSVVSSAVVTLLTIPILIGHSGAAAWGSLAVGQAVGTGAAILMGYGWGTTGPTAIARSSGAQRSQIYLESFRARSLIAVPIVIVAVVVTLLASRHVPVESALNALGYSLTGLLAGWYFTGVARPYLFLVFDTAPRVLGAAAGAAAVLVGAPLVVFPLLQLVGVLLGIIGSTRHVSGRRARVFRGFRLGKTLEVLRGQSHGVVLALVGAAYSAVPASLVAVIAPAALPAYALVDKLLRFATTAYAPIVQFLQGWVPSGEKRDVPRKIRSAFVAGTVLAALGAVVFFLLAPWLSTILSHGDIVPASNLIVAFALVLFFMVMAQITGLVCLLALDKAQRLALFSTIGVLVGLPAVYVGALLFGAPGAAWMLALGELVALAPQLALLGASLRRLPDSKAAAV